MAKDAQSTHHFSTFRGVFIFQLLVLHVINLFGPGLDVCLQPFDFRNDLQGRLRSVRRGGIVVVVVLSPVSTVVLRERVENCLSSTH